MDYKKIKTLKWQVEHCLRESADTRNCDITLMIEVWLTFYPEYLMPNHAERYIAIKLGALYELPREDNIKRVRAHFQNKKKMYLPTDWKVAQKRGIAEDEWRVALGYPTKVTAGMDQPNWTPPSETKQLF